MTLIPLRFQTRQPQLKSVSVASPTATENITLFYTPFAITVSTIHSVVRGTSPSVTFAVRYASTRNSGSFTNILTTVNETQATGQNWTPNNTAVPANSWVWLVTTAVSGTIDEFHVTLRYA